MREVWEKGEDVDKIVYTCVVDNVIVLLMSFPI